MISTASFDDCTVLIVDDQSTSRTILSYVIQNINSNIDIVVKSSPEQALEWAVDHSADLILVDYLMPEMNGIDFVRLLKTLPTYKFVPVVMITVEQDNTTRYTALDAGVADFLNKPIDVYECTARCKSLLTLHQQHIALQNRSDLLESLVKVATVDIRSRENETLMRLARAGEYKDFDTARHLKRMSLYSRALAEALGFNEADAEVIELASPLHDIGKIGIPDSILLKKGKLDADELTIMRKHAQIGYEILQDSPSKYIQKGSEIALAHHEKFDGSGYPNGLVGNSIPLSARIVAIADVFDALTSERPYKKAWTVDAALDYIRDESGKHFDPAIVTVMLSMRSVLESIMHQHHGIQNSLIA